MTLLHHRTVVDPGEPTRIEVYDERFGRRVGVTFQPSDPDRLMLRAEDQQKYIDAMHDRTRRALEEVADRAAV